MTTVTYYFDAYDIGGEEWTTRPEDMVDGDEATAGQTWTNGDIQLCNTNTVPRDKGYPISKVELRVLHMETANYSNSNIRLRPVFSDGDGDNHDIVNSATAKVWSAWQDITNDTHAPTTWTWDNLHFLDCDVEAVIVDAGDGGLFAFKIEIRVTYDDTGCGSCNTFEIRGYSYTVDLKMPLENGEDNSISKNINRFNFWSGNYAINDDGINSQPLILHGIEHATCDSEYVGMCFGKCAPFNLYFNMKFTNKFRFIMEMSHNNEKVIVAGLGDCIHAIYIIKNFSYKTVTPRSRSWTMTLEKVRELADGETSDNYVPIHGDVEY